MLHPTGTPLVLCRVPLPELDVAALPSALTDNRKTQPCAGCLVSAVRVLARPVVSTLCALCPLHEDSQEKQFPISAAGTMVFLIHSVNIY